MPAAKLPAGLFSLRVIIERLNRLSHTRLGLQVVSRKPCKAAIDVGLIRRSALDLVLKLEKHRAVLFLVVAVEI
jgi:hypothetical protein